MEHQQSGNLKDPVCGMALEPETIPVLETKIQYTQSITNFAGRKVSHEKL